LIETNRIYHNVIEALKKRKERKFLVEHTGYLRLFLEAYPNYKSDVEALFEKKQLIMLNSASVSAPDEATTYF